MSNIKNMKDFFQEVVDIDYIGSQSSKHFVDETEVLKFYIKHSYNNISPNKDFDEKFYIKKNPDVDLAIKNKSFVNGYEHYIKYGKFENRSPKNIDNHSFISEISKPIALDNFFYLKTLFNENLIDISTVDKSDNKRIIFIFSELYTELIFAGYLAIFEFLVRMQVVGYEIVLMSLYEMSSREDFLSKFRNNQDLANFFKSVSLETNLISKGHISMFKNDTLMVCAWTSKIVADNIATRGGLNSPIYFLQEDETIFYQNDSFKLIAENMLKESKRVIINSHLLERSIQKKLQKKTEILTFEHMIPNIDLKNLNKKKKSIMVYARPEEHSKRNLFEYTTLFLNEIAKDGIIDDTWEINGYGSLAYEGVVELPNNVKFNLFKKVSLEHYKKALEQHQIGISLMYAPHPSVIPYEMIHANMCVLTNIYSNRNIKYYKDISDAFYPTKLCMGDMKKTFKKMISDIDKDSVLFTKKQEFPKNWDEVFNKEFLDNVCSMIRG